MQRFGNILVVFGDFMKQRGLDSKKNELWSSNEGVGEVQGLKDIFYTISRDIAISVWCIFGQTRRRLNHIAICLFHIAISLSHIAISRDINDSFEQFSALFEF